jgi:hypothetical protein
VKERPIYFKTESIKAILEGRKTQERRVIWPKILIQQYSTVMEKIKFRTGKTQCLFDFYHNDGSVSTIYGVRPKYRTGDLFWVKENFMVQLEPCESHPKGEVEYAADYPEQSNVFQYEGGGSAVKSCILMPRWASRLSLEVVNVRVEKVQEISASDALDEGVSHTEFWKPKDVENRPFEEKWWDDFHFWNHYPQIAYKNHWDSINAKRGYGWDTNPWVWVIEFRKVWQNGV